MSFREYSSPYAVNSRGEEEEEAGEPLLETASDTDSDNSMASPASRLSCSVALLLVLVLLGQLGHIISLPIFVDAVGFPYFALVVSSVSRVVIFGGWCYKYSFSTSLAGVRQEQSLKHPSMIYVGFMYALNAILAVYASPGMSSLLIFS